MSIVFYHELAISDAEDAVSTFWGIGIGRAPTGYLAFLVSRDNIIFRHRAMLARAELRRREALEI